MTRIAIMQPTYLPWIGYFDMIDQTDTFVFLDSVQFNTRSWQQRNRIKSPAEILWLTVPVLTKGRRDQHIDQAEIDATQNFAVKHLNAIAFNYAKAPYFARYFDSLKMIYEKGQTRLADLTIDLTQWVCAQFGIHTPTLRSSALAVEGKKTELLVAICQALKASQYLSAEGSREYIEENNLFHVHQIGLDYHNYRHPEYRQLHGAFTPFLSALDLLFNEGPGSLAIIRAGRQAPMTAVPE